MIRYTVRLNLPLTLVVYADSDHEAHNKAMEASRTSTTPEMISDAWDIINACGESYETQFTEIIRIAKEDTK